MAKKQGFFELNECKNSRDQGQKKLRKLLAWVYKWGWMTVSNVERLLGGDRTTASRFVKRRYLRREKPALNAKIAFTILRSVIHDARDEYLGTPGAIIGLPYPFIKNPPPLSKLGKHQCLAQNIAIAELKKQDGILLCERELGKKYTSARPDFEITRDERVEWHEIELNSKYCERLHHQLMLREEARAAGQFHKIIWWCSNENIRKVLMDAISQPIIKKTEHKLAIGKVIYLDDEEGWRPLKLNMVSEFRLIDHDANN